MEIPYNIREIIAKKSRNIDDIGMSGASVYLYNDVVLKIQDYTKESENEYTMMRWLSGKLPVPDIIEYTNTNKLSYLLMSKCAGKMACDEVFMSDPKQQAKLLADTLQALWAVDSTGCPSDSRLSHKLKQAEYNVSNGLVDPNTCEPETFCKHGFRDPEALLYWLKNNAPDEEPVLSHGDFCLPNVLFADGMLSGIIDLGRSGIADKWCDIAICYRSLKHNYDGTYTGKQNTGYRETYLFDALQIKPDWEKIRYYMLLDELF